MEISKVKHWTIPIPLSRPYSIAYKTVHNIELIVVAIELSDGTSGIGTASPSHYVTGETYEHTRTQLDSHLESTLLKQDYRHLNGLLTNIKNAFASTPAARFAIETALYEVFCKKLGISLVHFLGQKHQGLPTSITIGIKNIADTINEAQEYYDRKFKVLKVKIGSGNLEEDIERLFKLKEKFGNHFIIRVDANQAYDIAQMQQFYAKTQSLALELIEQPFKADETVVEKMQMLSPEMRNHCAADESLLNTQDAWRLAIASQDPSFGIFNIKMMKAGGISEALLMSQIATQKNIRLMWGCNDESIISITAALHTAYACHNTQYIDLDGSFDLASDIAKGGFELKNGQMYTSEQPGLGIDVFF